MLQRLVSSLASKACHKEQQASKRRLPRWQSKRCFADLDDELPLLVRRHSLTLVNEHVTEAADPVLLAVLADRMRRPDLRRAKRE